MRPSYCRTPPRRERTGLRSERMEILLRITVFLWNVFILRRAKILIYCETGCGITTCSSIQWTQQKARVVHFPPECVF